ncbi:MaoC/PaaZ C-terminal domain-containing protein [Pseudoalteromonas obscura]|uniref:MaoC/PaaZ C-terminal domain-containing protein n=1 Tax=Pseudoalteromonas obscura TaxID=3048491 RepID=A0ABT7EMC2_9GAMM|nr:MaoC/PaaZ C-terminal domain-containing protein [Pseudoalteromonas sp. P94(2023)]MDK2596212.1 MaoC/PaaZ C-terminal domain-containing protein [Pseudoalteromonas sp. P94(2023)]
MKLENVVFEDIEIGQSAIRTRLVQLSDIQDLSILPEGLSLDNWAQEYANNMAFQGAVVQGTWTAAQISAVINTQLPGPGAVYLSQDLKFALPVVVGDVITTKVTVIDKDFRHGSLIIDCQCSNQRKEEVVFGIATVRAPTEKICIEIKSTKEKALNSAC